jgi:cobalt-zinc-cadmium efflux system protein
MGHHHHHDHGHAHGIPEGQQLNTAFIVGIVLNMAFVVVELYYGSHYNSKALMADAVHNAADVLGLIIAWAGNYMMAKRSFGQFTYGLKRSSIIASLLNSTLLMVAVGGIGWETVRTFTQAHEVGSMAVIITAAVGIAVNGISAWLLLAGSKGDVNVRSAFWHLVTDALVSVGVVVAGALIWYTGLEWIDNVTSIIILIIIVAGTWDLMRDSLKLALDAAPETAPVDEVREYLLAIKGVSKIHDLHIWNLSTRQTALTVHLVKPDGLTDDTFLHNLEHELQHRYGISHTTIQVEKGSMDHGGEAC